MSNKLGESPDDGWEFIEMPYLQAPPQLPAKCECGRDRDGGLVITDGEEVLLAICVYCFRDAVRGGLSQRIPPPGMA